MTDWEDYLERQEAEQESLRSQSRILREKLNGIPDDDDEIDEVLESLEWHYGQQECVRLRTLSAMEARANGEDLLAWKLSYDEFQPEPLYYPRMSAKYKRRLAVMLHNVIAARSSDI